MVKIKYYNIRGYIRARISYDGKREEKTFKTQKEASSWAIAREFEIEGKKNKTFEPEQIKIMPIADAIKHHVAMRLEKSGNRGGDKSAFKQFYDFIFERGRDYIHEIRPDDLEAYQSHRKSKVKASSVNREFAALGGFFSKCVKRGYIKQSPMLIIEKLAEEPVKKVTWTDNEIALVFSKLPKHLKNYIFFIYSTGCRPIEATNLQFEKIDLEKRTLTLTSFKGGRRIDRTLPISAQVVEMIEKIRNERRFAKQADFVFINTKNNKVTPITLSKKVRMIRRELGLRDAITPYKLRHTYISELIIDDIGLAKVQALAGHKRVQTTMGYFNMPESELRSVVTSLDEKRREKMRVI